MQRFQRTELKKVALPGVIFKLTEVRFTAHAPSVESIYDIDEYLVEPERGARHISGLTVYDRETAFKRFEQMVEAERQAQAEMAA